jgi:hypothetical protein
MPLEKRDRLAIVGICLWAGSALLLVVAFVIGIFVASTGRGGFTWPGGGTGESWATLLLPIFALVIGLPLNIAAIIVAGISLARRRRRKVLAIATIVLASLPCAAVLLFLLWRVF